MKSVNSKDEPLEIGSFRSLASCMVRLGAVFGVIYVLYMVVSTSHPYQGPFSLPSGFVCCHLSSLTCLHYAFFLLALNHYGGCLKRSLTSKVFRGCIPFWAQEQGRDLVHGILELFNETSYACVLVLHVIIKQFLAQMSLSYSFVVSFLGWVNIMISTFVLEVLSPMVYVSSM